jgi:hypothetical protein
VVFVSAAALNNATSITPQAEGSHGGKHTLATGGKSTIKMT